jgi:DNA-binding GntR family transcriptional regulator
VASRVRGAKDRALEFVKDQVLTGAYPGGELISEGEVAEALGMSRTPVREAFLRLEAEGLLRLYPQRGALVVPVSPEEVRAVLESRLLLEQFAAAKVAGKQATVRGTVYEQLAAEINRQRDAALAADFREFLEADRVFHTILVEIAGNHILTGVYRSLRDRQMRMIGESAIRDPRRSTTILAEHEVIAESVRDGDLGRAIEAVTTHLTSTAQALGLSANEWPPTDPVVHTAF